MSAQLALAPVETKPMGPQLRSVFWCLAHRYNEWWTLRELQDGCASYGVMVSEAGVSARLRDLRKRPYGSHIIERRRRGEHLWEYRLVR